MNPNRAGVVQDYFTGMARLSPPTRTDRADDLPKT
jgi:hypothetical protein